MNRTAFNESLVFLQLSDAELANLLTVKFGRMVSFEQVMQVRQGKAPVPKGWWLFIRSYWRELETRSAQLRIALTNVGPDAIAGRLVSPADAYDNPASRIVSVLFSLNLSEDLPVIIETEDTA